MKFNLKNMNFEEMNNPELYDWCKFSGKKALTWRKKFIAALPEVYKRHLYKEYGFGSIFEFAAKLGGISHGMVEDAIRVDKKLEEMPKLKSLMPKVGLSKLRRVASVAEKKTENEWAEKVQKMSKPALETHIRDIKNSRPGPGIPNTTQEVVFDNEFENFSVKLDPKIILKLKQLKNKMPKGTNWNEVFEKLLPEEPKPQKNPKASNPKSRAVPAQKRREALNKSSGLCSAPGCNKPATEIHHKKPWSIFRSHKDLEALCKGHHELAHQSETAIDRKFRIYKMQAALF